MQQPIRVLVVDDSAFLRTVVRHTLARHSGIEVVATARDGREALALVELHHPDVVILDLIMPVLDGLGFIETQMRRRPVPIVICSSTHESAELALAALEAGAVDFVQKPAALTSQHSMELGAELVSKVIAAAAVKMDRSPHRLTTAAPAAPVRVGAGQSPAMRAEIVVIGVSTGGPQALRLLIPQLTPAFPAAVAVVLHLPIGYTEAYAQRLAEISRIPVQEAKEGDELRPARVLLAPAGRHLAFARDVNGLARVQLRDRPDRTAHRPAVDVLFASAAEIFGPRVLGVVMTGMGTDGLVGSRQIKARGGRIITESESSCVVYGMPRVVNEAALSDRTVPLDQIAHAIMEMV